MRVAAEDRDRKAVRAIAAAHLVIAAVLAMQLPLWVDEMYTLHSTAAGPVDAARNAAGFELQGTSYFVLVSLWRQLFPWPLAARVPSVLFGVATVLAGAALSRRLIPSVQPRWAALLIAFHPLAIFASCDARLYSLAMLIGVTFCLVAYRAHIEGWIPGRAFVVILGALALYTQQYLGFVLAGAGVALVAVRRYRDAAWYAAEMALVVVLAIPLLVIVREQIHVQVGAQGGSPRLGSVFWTVESSIAALALPFSPFSSATVISRMTRWLVRLLALAAAVRCIWMYRSRARTLPPLAWLTTLVIVASVVGSAMTSVAGTLWNPRYQIGLLGVTLLLLVAAATAVLPRMGKSLLALVLLGFSAQSAIAIAPLAKRGDCERVARAIERLEKRQEPILVVPADDVLCLAAYYRGRNQLVPVPHSRSRQVWRLDGLVTGSVADVPKTARLEELLPRGPEDVWEALRVAGNPESIWVYGDTFGGTVERVLSEGWVEDQVLEFYGDTFLRRFTRRADSQRNPRYPREADEPPRP